ncbi:MAG: diacylglycerol kinase family protein [Aggregatilineales bacterium]
MTPKPDPAPKRHPFRLHPDIRATLEINPDQHSPVTSHSRLASFRYALAGSLHVLRYGKNIRIQALATVVVFAIGVWIGLSSESWAILVLTVTINWMAEFTNSAIEAAVNLASPEHHPMARVSKDVAAGTSLLAACAAVIIGLLLLGPPLLSKIASLFAK